MSDATDETGEETALDRAMRLSGGDATDGRAVDALLNAELFLLLEAPAEDGPPRPRVLPLEAGPTALAFDREERLAAFGDGAHYLAAPGRDLAALLAERGLNLAVNAGVAPSELFHDAAALAWMATAVRAEAAEARLSALGRPDGASEALIAALDSKLAALGAALREAWLVSAVADDERRLALLLVERGVWGAGDAAEAHRGALARAVGETARLAGATLEVGFAAEGPLLEAARRVGLGFEPPAPQTAAPRRREGPPRLR
ncbi:MAG: SseB family protein [Paracoccaceae bacterium]